jgi:hypothetical protein
MCKKQSMMPMAYPPGFPDEEFMMTFFRPAMETQEQRRQQMVEDLRAGKLPEAPRVRMRDAVSTAILERFHARNQEKRERADALRREVAVVVRNAWGEFTRDKAVKGKSYSGLLHVGKLSETITRLDGTPAIFDRPVSIINYLPRDAEGRTQEIADLQFQVTSSGNLVSALRGKLPPLPVGEFIDEIRQIEQELYFQDDYVRENVARVFDHVDTIAGVTEQFPWAQPVVDRVLADYLQPKPQPRVLEAVARYNALFAEAPEKPPT